MTKIILCSSFADSYEKIIKELNTSLSGKSMTFIPTAGNVEEHTFYIDEAKDILTELGAELSVVDINRTSKESIINTLTKNEFIYVAGGNTFYLLQELKAKQIDEAIVVEIENGKTYIGESAGAVITSQNIDYVQLMDNKDKAPQLTDTTGLSLTNISPLPHLNNDYFGEVVQDVLTKYQHRIELMPITDQEIIIIHDQEISVK